MTLDLFGSDLTLADAYRFARLVKSGPPTECWIWQGSVDSGGYGTFRLGSATLASHRVAYAIHRGPFPRCQHVLHTCDTPNCCNPGHLFLGTHAENMADMAAKGRNLASRRGNGQRKVNPAEYYKIKAMDESGVSRSEIGRIYGVTATTVRFILKKVAA